MRPASRIFSWLRARDWCKHLSTYYTAPYVLFCSRLFSVVLCCSAQYGHRPAILAAYVHLCIAITLWLCHKQATINVFTCILYYTRGVSRANVILALSTLTEAALLTYLLAYILYGVFHDEKSYLHCQRL